MLSLRRGTLKAKRPPSTPSSTTKMTSVSTQARIIVSVKTKASSFSVIQCLTIQVCVKWHQSRFDWHQLPPFNSPFALHQQHFYVPPSTAQNFSTAQSIRGRSGLSGSFLYTTRWWYSWACTGIPSLLGRLVVSCLPKPPRNTNACAVLFGLFPGSTSICTHNPLGLGSSRVKVDPVSRYYCHNIHCSYTNTNLLRKAAAQSAFHKWNTRDLQAVLDGLVWPDHVWQRQTQVPLDQRSLVIDLSHFCSNLITKKHNYL